MNPYKEDGPCARLSFDRAYCKRCIAPPSVNDGYMTGTGVPDRRRRRPPPGRMPAPATTRRHMANRRPPRRPGTDGRPPNAIAAIETLVRQRSNGAFIMRV